MILKLINPLYSAYNNADLVPDGTGSISTRSADMLTQNGIILT